MRSVAGTDLTRLEYLEFIRRDYSLMVQALSGPVVSVPTCPGWDMNMLAEHMGNVYLHQAFVVESGIQPKDGEHLVDVAEISDPMELLAAGYEAIIKALHPDREERQTWSWHHSDFTVDFWFRRMAHETVIHRCDAQIARGLSCEIDENLALDGVDEVLDFLPLLGSWSGAPNVDYGVMSIEVVADSGTKHWTLEFTSEKASVVKAESVDVRARLVVSGDALAMDLYLWGRITSADSRITLTGTGEEGFTQLMQVAVN